MRAQVREFSAADLDAAGQLLARRHARHRQVEPLLDVRYEDAEQARTQVTEVWQSQGASGAVAERDGHMLGYLLGAPKTSAVWGPNIWVESTGHALGERTGVEVARDLYAHAARRWVDDGRSAHYVMLPAHDAALLNAWWRLGFGQQHTHGIQAASAGFAAESAPGVRVRAAERADIPRLAEIDMLLPLHQQRSPVFSAAPAEVLAELLADWTETFDDAAYTHFIGELDGEVVGAAVGCSLLESSAHSGLLKARHAAFLGFAAVSPPAQGHGVGRALGQAVLSWAADAGYASIVTDWRITNLEASRTWPALGFRPMFLRLHRLVGY